MAASSPLRLVGQVEEPARYRALAEGLGIADRVFFHEPMPAREAFASARVIVVPSRAESMPYVVLEAIAAGMPIIATRVGGIPEIFGAAADELVAPGDPAELARAIDEPVRQSGAHGRRCGGEALVAALAICDRDDAAPDQCRLRCVSRRANSGSRDRGPVRKAWVQFIAANPSARHVAPRPGEAASRPVIPERRHTPSGRPFGRPDTGSQANRETGFLRLKWMRPLRGCARAREDRDETNSPHALTPGMR